MKSCFFDYLFTGTVNASLIYDNSNPGSMVVSWDETFTMTTSSNGLTENYLFLVVEDLFLTSDGAGFLSDVSSLAQTVSINGGSAVSVSNWNGWQYRGGPELDYNQLDGLFGLRIDTLLPSFNIGDSFHWIGSMTVNENSIIRMSDIQGGTTAYIANVNGRHSNTVNTSINHSVSVPEPTPLALLCLGLAGIGFSRNKKSA